MKIGTCHDRYPTCGILFFVKSRVAVLALPTFNMAFKASEMAKSLELPGAPPPRPLPGFCPGPAGWLTAPPGPQLF